jgi:hypothetical protein
VEAARQIHQSFSIPVIFLTAYADEDTVERAKATQPFGYILKPFKQKELQANIEITLSKHRTEQKLKEREEWLTTVLQSIGDAVIATDMQGRVTFMNRSAEELSGWTQEEVWGKDAAEIFSLIQEDTQEPIVNPLGEVLAREQEVGLPENTLLIAKNQRQIPIKDTASPIKNDRGEITGAVWVFRDITLAKQAQQGWRESEARSRRLVESNIIGIMIADVRGNFIQVNEAFLSTVGYSKVGFFESNLRWTDMTPPEYRILDDRALERVRETGTCQPFEKEFIAADGRRVSVLVGMALLEETRDRFVAFVLDITERKQLENARREQAAQLAEASRMKDEFLGMVSHELRTPLNAILGWSQLLRQRRLQEAKMDKALESIERNAKEQVKIIDDILDASRIIRGKMRLNLLPLNLEEAIATAIADLRPTATAKNIRLEAVCDEALGPVLADPDRLHQVLWHLLSNGIKFTPMGGQIRVILHSRDNHAEIQVNDTGIGIPPEFLPYVFDRFRQADSTTTRANGGLGLGLSLVRYLVELHGGAIAVTSEGIGKGATFTLHLPFAKQTPALGDDGGNGKVQNAPILLEGVRVLVVDDDADTCELIDFILKEYGADVTWVTSATEALDAIAPIKPAVLISDLGMPERDGYWLIRQVRGRDNGNGKLPAVALTAFAREEDRDRALQAGFQMHLASAHRTRAVGDGADVSGGKNILNWSLVICHWSFVIGHLSLVVCHWSLVG